MELPRKPSAALRRLNPELFGSDPKAKEEVRTINSHNDDIARIPRPEKPSGQVGAKYFTIHAEPVPAPRMTRSDKWKVGPKRRPIVQRYFDYRDVLRQAIGDLPIVPDELHAIFHFPMPESWSKKKRQAMHGQPHRQRPDRDNCEKAIMDSLFLEDGGVWKGSSEKRWAIHGRVELAMVWL